MKKINLLLLVTSLLLILGACTSETEKMIKEAERDTVVTFGVYEQDGNAENGAEPIEWRVLEKNNNEMLLLSEYILDSKAYNEAQGSVIWEESSLREWLNGDFFAGAFSEEEKLYIAESTNKNPGNSDYQVPDANDTADKVFLPCAVEIYDGFIPERYVKARASEYAKANGVEVRSEEYCMWWLRCCSVENNYGGNVYAATADDLGKAFARGRQTILPSVGVRPMVRIRIPE